MADQYAYKSSGSTSSGANWRSVTGGSNMSGWAAVVDTALKVVGPMVNNQLAKDWERKKMTHSARWRAHDLRKAGLNPILALGGMQPQMASSNNPGLGHSGGVSDSFKKSMEKDLVKSQIAQVNATTGKNLAETEQIIEATEQLKDKGHLEELKGDVWERVGNQVNKWLLNNFDSFSGKDIGKKMIDTNKKYQEFREGVNSGRIPLINIGGKNSGKVDSYKKAKKNPQSKRTR